MFHGREQEDGETSLKVLNSSIKFTNLKEFLYYDSKKVKHITNLNIDFKSYKYVDVYHLLKVVLTKEDLEQIGSLKLSNVFKFVTGKDLQNAHDAESDVKGCKKILDWVLNNYDVDDCIYLTHEYLTGQPVGLDYKFYTGKHPEKTVSDLITQDPNYLKFMQSKGLLILDSSITI